MYQTNVTMINGKCKTGNAYEASDYKSKRKSEMSVYPEYSEQHVNCVHGLMFHSFEHVCHFFTQKLTDQHYNIKNKSKTKHGAHTKHA